MEDQKLILFNRLVSGAYECTAFPELLQLCMRMLHKLVAYESGMFFCAISKDCSFFKPCADGGTESCCRKHSFPGQEYLELRERENAGREALVYRAAEVRQDVVSVGAEPRSDFLTQQEEYHVACMRIVCRGQFVGEIYLHRSRDEPDFDDEDLFVLGLLQPHISTVFQYIHTAAAECALGADRGRIARKGLCLLDGELSIEGGNASGLEMLKTPTVFGSNVLYHVKEMCEDLLSESRENPAVISRQSSLRTNSGMLSIDLTLLREGKATGGAGFLASMELRDEWRPEAEYKYRFSKREADIIDGLVMGKNNSQLAVSLGLSENTVKTHIQNIYRKVGANNRTELTYLLLNR